MKPFVAIGGVLDYLFAKYFGSVSVEKCAQTENLYSAHEAVSGPGMDFLSRTASRALCAISVWAQSASKMP